MIIFLCSLKETVSVVQKKQTVSGTQHSTKLFEFDRVYGPQNRQDEVFEDLKPLLTSLLDGYNVCIMAYGQTGSGKTHTMLSRNGGLDPANQDGVIPLAAEHIFRYVLCTHVLSVLSSMCVGGYIVAPSGHWSYNGF